MKGASEQNRLAASSKFKVPTALVSKSSNGMVGARSCDGGAAQWTIAPALIVDTRARTPGLLRMSSSWCWKLRRLRSNRRWFQRVSPSGPKNAERLLSDLNTIEWSDSLKEMQRNWIGRSEGAEVDFQIVGSPHKIQVFTTRPDTLFCATYMVLSPEHKLVSLITTQEQKKPVEEYRVFAAGKSDLERTELAKEKTG